MQLDTGLFNKSHTICQTGQAHIIYPNPQHWCPSRMCDNYTPAYSLQLHHQICRYSTWTHHK
ncbi:hypothetical protein LDENG_00203710 [Lucifuga dentata]|nr:hypothetical protein LDENG_00203710 [Lucifuga dentata]